MEADLNFFLLSVIVGGISFLIMKKTDDSVNINIFPEYKPWVNDHKRKKLFICCVLWPFMPFFAYFAYKERKEYEKGLSLPKLKSPF